MKTLTVDNRDAAVRHVHGICDCGWLDRPGCWLIRRLCGLTGCVFVRYVGRAREERDA